MTKTDIANLALSKLGQPAITSITDADDRDARLCNLHYDHALKEALRAHFWGFAVTCQALVAHAVQSIFISGTLEWDGSTVVFPELKPAVDDEWSSDGNESAPATGMWYRLLRSSPTWTLSIFEDGAETGFWESTTDPDTPDGLEFEPSIGATGVATAAFGTSKSIMPWAVAWTYPPAAVKLCKLMDSYGNKVEDFEFRRIDGARRILTRNLTELNAEYVAFVDDPDEYDPAFLEAFVTLLASKIARVITGSEAIEGDMRQLYESNALPAARTADSHDSRSNENRPIDAILKGSLLRPRGDYLTNLDD